MRIIRKLSHLPVYPMRCVICLKKEPLRPWVRYGLGAGGARLGVGVGAVTKSCPVVQSYLFLMVRNWAS